ncbi:MAG: carboxypeptidase-like regulatory domain-containing protein [Terriglobales bacterium]
MMKSRAGNLAIIAALLSAPLCAAQSSNYRVIAVQDGGTIRGSVKWQGPLPRLVPSQINKDPQICDPEGQKRRDLERLIVGGNSGVANTVVFLKDITKGKAMDLPEPRRFLNQKSCRYEPHILLVPLQGNLQIKSSDPTLHTVHMSGAADYNLPFPFKDLVVQRTMNREGLVDLRCNAGHVWMNAEMMVAPHPYFAVTDQDGTFEITQIPPGDYEIVAWHEGWRVVGESELYDVISQVRVKRPVFSAPVTWSKHVTVPAHDTAEVHFILGGRTPQMPMGH